jgi:error-prone DNA polymerase
MDHVVPLKELTPWERMQGEYRTMGVHPEAHLMAYMRDHLPGVMISIEMRGLAEGSEIEVAGLVIRRQRPLAKAVFITLEDEFGHIPIIIWPEVYRRYRHVIKDPILRVKGTVSRRDNTINMVMSHAEPISVLGTVLPRSKNWG